MGSNKPDWAWYSIMFLIGAACIIVVAYSYANSDDLPTQTTAQVAYGEYPSAEDLGIGKCFVPNVIPENENTRIPGVISLYSGCMSVGDKELVKVVITTKASITYRIDVPRYKIIDTVVPDQGGYQFALVSCRPGWDDTVPIQDNIDSLLVSVNFQVGKQLHSYLYS